MWLLHLLQFRFLDDWFFAFDLGIWCFALCLEDYFQPIDYRTECKDLRKEHLTPLTAPSVPAPGCLIYRDPSLHVTTLPFSAAAHCTWPVRPFSWPPLFDPWRRLTFWKIVSGRTWRRRTATRASLSVSSAVSVEDGTCDARISILWRCSPTSAGVHRCDPGMWGHQKVLGVTLLQLQFIVRSCRGPIRKCTKLVSGVGDGEPRHHSVATLFGHEPTHHPLKNCILRCKSLQVSPFSFS